MATAEKKNRKRRSSNIWKKKLKSISEKDNSSTLIYFPGNL